MFESLVLFNLGSEQRMLDKSVLQAVQNRNCFTGLKHAANKRYPVVFSFWVIDLKSDRALKICDVHTKNVVHWVAKAKYKQDFCHRIASGRISQFETQTLPFCPNGETGKRLRTRDSQIYFQILDYYNGGED